MATEKIEIQILAKGKPAEKAIGKVERKTEQLGKTTKKTGKDIDGVLTRMKAGWIAVGIATAKALTAGKTFERMSLGLTKSQKEWAKQTSLLTDVTAAQVAGFLKSAQTAGLAEEQMKDLAEQAIALGYAFPHEAAETLHDNLVMLAKTGEAQGFVVDILEQKYVSLGENITTLDLKTKSTAEKMKLVGEVAEKSQQQMDASEYKELEKASGSLSNALIELGDAFIMLLSSMKVNFAIEGATVLFNLLEAGGKSAKALWNDTKQNQLEAAEATLHYLDAMEKMTGNKAWSSESNDAAILRTAIHSINKELGLAEEKVRNLQVTVVPDNAIEWTWLDTLKAKIRDLGEGLSTFARKGKDELDTLHGVGEKVGKGIEDTFVNMAMGVKTSFKSMIQSIISDLIRLQVRRTIIAPLGNIFSGLFHTGGEVKHTGGAIGTTKIPSFHTGGAIETTKIPSFHTGVRSDERLAKLQVGEAVINRGGAVKNKASIEAMNKGYSVGGNGGQVTTAEINFNVQAIDAASFNSYLINNRSTIEGIINASLTTNGSVRRTIKQVV